MAAQQESHMRRTSVFLAILIGFFAAGATAQSFTFYSTLHAGQPGGGDWEIGTGLNLPITSAWSTAHFDADGPGNWWVNGQAQTFRIGYNAATNSAYTTVFNAAPGNPLGASSTATLVNPGAAPATTTWTLPAASFNVRSSFNGASITVQNLTLGPNVNLLSGVLPTNLTAAQSGGFSVGSRMSAPLVIDAAANGGSWYIQGVITMAGLQGSGNGAGARNAQLQFNLAATGSDTPEATTMSLLGAGLLVMGWMRRRARAGTQK
jgi:hypothetical protein